MLRKYALQSVEDFFSQGLWIPLDTEFPEPPGVVCFNDVNRERQTFEVARVRIPTPEDELAVGRGTLTPSKCWEMARCNAYLLACSPRLLKVARKCLQRFLTQGDHTSAEVLALQSILREIHPPLRRS